MRTFWDSLQEIERTVCLVMSGHGDTSLVPSFAVGDHLEFLEKNEVLPHVTHAMRDAGMAVSEEQWVAHEVIRRRIGSYLAELDGVAAAMKANDIDVVALKNAGIARGIFTCPGCCPMGDIDVLVRKRDFRAAHRVMLDSGYTFEFRSPLDAPDLQAAENGGGAEYWKLLDDGQKLWFELQWRPVAGRWIRPDQEPSGDELMDRSLPILGTDTRLLSPEDNLLQVALHTAKHTYVRAPGFRLHTDVDRIVNTQRVEWDVVVERVERLQVRTAVYFSLAIPAAVFGTPVPADVLCHLRPAWWKERVLTRWICRAGLFNPEQKKFSKGGYILVNALMYDSLRGLGRGIFPESHWMRERYGCCSKVWLPWLYLKRLYALMFHRVGI